MKIEKSNLLKVSSALVALVGLSFSACSSSGGDESSNDTTSTELTGKAIDGYLQNARVCIDLNANTQCDADEPNAMTDDNGEFSITTELSDLSNYNVVVEAIVGQTIDSDEPGVTIQKAFFLKAPASEPKVISPITTLVQNSMELDTSLTKEDAIAQVRKDLNVPDSIDIIGDYIALKSGADASEYEKIHTVAKVVVEAIAKTIDENTNISEENYGISTKSMLSDISTKINTIAVDVEKEDFNYDSYVSTIAVAIEDTVTIEETVAIEDSDSNEPSAEETQQITKNIHFEDLLKDGKLYSFYFDGDFNLGRYDYGTGYGNSQEQILYQVSTLHISDFSLQDLKRQYFRTGGEEKSVDYFWWGYPEYFGADVSFDATTYAMTQESVYGVYDSNVTEVRDISGELITDILTILDSGFAGNTDIPTFTAGSELVKVTSTRTLNYNTTGQTLLTKLCLVDENGVESCTDTPSGKSSDKDTIVRYYINDVAYQDILANF